MKAERKLGLRGGKKGSRDSLDAQQNRLRGH